MDNVERFQPNLDKGLDNEQVQSRINDGLHNEDNGVKTKSCKQIIFDNTFTFFNTINFVFAILILITAVISEKDFITTGKNMLFMGVIFSNIAIGSFQEIRSKKIIDKLSLISAPKAHVLRNGNHEIISVSDVVLDDILILNAGNQVCSDSIILEGDVEVNESLITGESDPVSKKAGDSLLSGSFIISGTCKALADKVGEDNYAFKIARDAKYLKKSNSQILDSLNMIVKFVGFSVIPVGLLLFSKQFFITGDSLYLSVVTTIAALIGMIPEGLVLLTSIVFAVSVVRLASHKTLVQELYCIETLARVDVLCLDKTGTITEGSMQVDETFAFGEYKNQDIENALSALTANLTDENPTFCAVKEKFNDPTTWKCSNTVAFSSQRKWSGASFDEHGTYIIGAGEFILGDRFNEIKSETEKYSNFGQRVLLLVHSDEQLQDKTLPNNLTIMGLVIISDKIRKEAPQTLKYFAEQGVNLKVISGDNAVTVANIAKKAGLMDADKYIDASTLKSDEELEQAILNNNVFGRVTPEQKLKFVKALKKNGHTVAMTGDGVNDVLALKEADCSVAMASGSDAARTVSNLVLMDSNFASMPKVVKEGRRSINNLQRSATLFLSKTIYSILMSIMFIFVASSFPYEPIQITLISTLCIGVPSFFLALEPNKELVKGHFLINVISKSLPTGLTIFANIIILVILDSIFKFSPIEFSSLAVYSNLFVSMLLLIRICKPFSAFHIVIISGVLLSIIISYFFFPVLFSITQLNLIMFIILVCLAIFSVILMNIILSHLDRLSDFIMRKIKF